MRYRKKAVVIEATQWFKNGDHPQDDVMRPYEDTGKFPDEPREGKVVRYYRNPNDSGERLCGAVFPGGNPVQIPGSKQVGCGHTMHEHGWIDTLEGGHIVCPGDFIITGVKGERYPCKPDIFAETYETA